MLTSCILLLAYFYRLEAIHSNKNGHACLHDDADGNTEGVTPPPRDVTGARAVVCRGTEGRHQPPPCPRVGLSLGRWWLCFRGPSVPHTPLCLLVCQISLLSESQRNLVASGVLGTLALEKGLMVWMLSGCGQCQASQLGMRVIGSVEPGWAGSCRTACIPRQHLPTTHGY